MMRKHWNFFDQIIKFDTKSDQQDIEFIYRSPRPQSKRKMEYPRPRPKFRNHQPDMKSFISNSEQERNSLKTIG